MAFLMLLLRFLKGRSILAYGDTSYECPYVWRVKGTGYIVLAMEKLISSNCLLER